ncbi:MAG: hypothetical protein IH586_21900 [Anaerolineaceae bacterium]|nr:hypothetical protein [Anaerolineaceae bacterium]
MYETRYILPDLTAVIDLHRAAIAVLAADMQSDPKKQGKEKKPGFHRVGLVFLDN